MGIRKESKYLKYLVYLEWFRIILNILECLSNMVRGLCACMRTCVRVCANHVAVRVRAYLH